MANYISFRDGGKTDQQGIFRYFTKMFTQGMPTVDSATTLQVTQRGAGANMSVDLAIGDVHIPYTTFSFYGFTDAIVNKSITAADPTNPRRDIVVAYVDLSVVNSASNDNPNALNFAVVAGTPAGSPVDPSGATIQAAVGSGNPYVQIARIAVAAAASSIVNANITDLRAPIAVKANLWGGVLNTLGHIVPNIADDTVALLNAVQTFANKTFTSPVLNTPTITSWDGWQAISSALSSVTANGGRNFTLVFNGVDLTSILTIGMKLKLTRTVTAPTQCTSLDGSTQWYSKTSPAGMTFTDDFVASAWVKMNSYGTNMIASRCNNTSGWLFFIDATGKVTMQGMNSGAGNISVVASYQAIPINKWVHVTAQLDMSGFTATPTTSYTMIDGVDVPSAVSRSGTNPTALIQAGNLEIGSFNGGTFPFPGRLAQVAVYSAKVTQANIRATMSQALAGSETSLISAYSFSNSINDLNVSNANNLTANGSAVATNADTPFSGGSGGSLEYGEVFDISFSTNTTITVQVPDGYQIPTTGGVSANAYAIGGNAKGWPGPITILMEALFLSSHTSITAETDLNGYVLTGYIPKNRRYKLYLNTSVDSSVSDTSSWLSLKESSVYLNGRGAPQSNGGYKYIVVEWSGFTSTGNHTFKAALQRFSGTGTVQTVGGAAAANTPGPIIFRLELA